MFNTLSYAKKLEEVGLPREQAEAHVQIIADIIEGELATKQDLRELEHRLVIKLSAILGTMISLTIAVCTAIMHVA